MVTIIICILAIIAVVTVTTSMMLVRKGLHHKPLGLDEERYLSQVVERHYPGTTAWIESKKTDGTLKETTLTSDDGLKIHAYYMATKDAKRTVVLTHGYSGCAMQMMPMARMWMEELHANVLVHDLPHHGRSEGEITCMGWTERHILRKWAYKASEMFPDTDIYLHGISMGGATTLMTADEKLPERVKGIISDSAYYSAWGVFGHDLKKNHIPTFPCLNLASLICKISHGWYFNEAAPIDHIAGSNLPILLVHGDADNRVPLSHGEKLYAKAKHGKTELWIVPGAEHVAALITDPKGYRERIETFFEILD